MVIEVTTTKEAPEKTFPDCVYDVSGTSKLLDSRYLKTAFTSSVAIADSKCTYTERGLMITKVWIWICQEMKRLPLRSDQVIW